MDDLKKIVSKLNCHKCSVGKCEVHEKAVVIPQIVGTIKTYNPEKKEVTLFKNSNLVNTQNNQNE